jgi:putative NADH-flavin reductase
MKKIVIIGASGFIGSAILKEALNRGHIVKAVVRNIAKIKVSHPNLEVDGGDVTSEEVVATVCAGADVVISSYNPGWQNPDIANLTLVAYRAIIDGVKRAGVQRLLVVGGAGSLFVKPGVRLMDSGIFPEAFLPAVRALATVYFEFLEAEKNLDWAFFSPAGMIEPGERTGIFRLGKDDLISSPDGSSRISVEDYAVAMIDELENSRHHRERFTIGY